LGHKRKNATFVAPAVEKEMMKTVSLGIYFYLFISLFIFISKEKSEIVEKKATKEV
jgi:hypothetical protein